MRQRKLVLSLTLLVVAATAFTLSQAIAGSAADASKRDVLINATRTSAASGEVVTLTGSGVFSLKEPTALFVRGYFLHKRADGSVVAEGYWKATKLESFKSFGGVPGTPLEGGRAVFDVTFFPRGGAPSVTFHNLTVTCVVGNPPKGAEEGVTVGPFTKTIEHPHRFTLFLTV